MSNCTAPPAGWRCSREPGHEGPCAAYPKKPYDGYINKVLSEITDDRSLSTLREYLIDAWMEGLKYSLVMIESEKRTREQNEA